MQLSKLAVPFALAMILAACGTPGPASVKGGDCKILTAELAQACGIRREDQRIIDESAEAGFAACRWQRAAKPTPSCEELRADIASLRAGIQPAARPAVKRKPSLRKRIKARIWPAKVEPVVPVPPMPKAEPALVPSDIIVRPADPLDDLLDVPASPVQPAPAPARKPRWWNKNR